MLFCKGVNLAAHTEKECRLRVFENRVLRRIYGPKRDEDKGELTRLCNEVNVKITLEQAMKAQKGSRGIAILFP